MFVNRTRYHTGVVMPYSSAYEDYRQHRRQRRRQERPRPLLLDLRRFPSWPPPGKWKSRRKLHHQQQQQQQQQGWLSTEEQESQAEPQPDEALLALLPLGSPSPVDEEWSLSLLHPLLLTEHFFWETFNTAAYELGGIICILGSVAFLPAFHAYLPVGVYLFIIGSLLYLIVAAHDTFEVLQAAEEAEDDDDDDDEDETRVTTKIHRHKTTTTTTMWHQQARANVPVATTMASTLVAGRDIDWILQPL